MPESSPQQKRSNRKTVQPVDVPHNIQKSSSIIAYSNQMKKTSSNLTRLPLSQKLGVAIVAYILTCPRGYLLKCDLRRLRVSHGTSQQFGVRSTGQSRS